MKIKFKIALLFTLLVTLIFLILGTSVYYFASLKRQKEFGDRLRFRALTNTRLLVELEQMDIALLRKIDSLTLNLLFEESISIYDQKNNLVYSNHNDQIDLPETIVAILGKVRQKNEYRFSVNEYQGIAAIYTSRQNNFVVLATATDRNGRNLLEQFKQILIASGLAGIIITLITGYLFSINLLRPLNRMNREMNEISSSNLSQRMPVSQKKDELNELALTFNNLLERLEISFNNQKRFIANASHELSTPLAAISSQLEVALMHRRTETEYKEVLTSVQEDVVQLNKLVKKLLELAKAGAGKGISLEPVRLDDILLTATEEVQKLHKDYTVSFSFDIIPDDENLCYIYGNQELLFIAFKNIMENACKYSTEHKAWISLSVDTSKKVIRIKDDGIGLNDEEKLKIFEPFFRTEKAQQLSEGLGLGLSMSSRIIRLHKGDIIIDSKPGEGSIFTITLPSI